MPAMEIYTSNDLNRLAATYAEHYQRAGEDIFAPNLVIVQSMGMQRWLSMQISRYCGICANMKFLFPNNFLKEIIDTLFLLKSDELEKCSRSAAIWTLMQELPKLQGDKTFSFVNNYLKDDALGVKLYQIAQRLADLYDQYALFRPLWIKSWPDTSPEKLQSFAAFTFKDNKEQQEAYVWQALLWQRCLMTHAHECQWPFLTEKMIGVMADPLRTARLPREVAVFGVSYLPPLYVDLLQIISRRTNVYLFLLNPCAKYWGDVVTKHRERAIQREFVDLHADLTPGELAEMAHLEGGNRLLANWGGLGKQLFQKIWEMDLPTYEGFDGPGYDSMLHVLQSDILEMQGRGANAPGSPKGVFKFDAEPLPFEADDRSLQVHVCHSPLREIEVLHDNLLAMFSRDEALQPEDVIVIAPDINVYEPYIGAVFANRVQNNCRIGFSIADHMSLEHGLVAAFFMLLDINKTRFEADKVLALLEIGYIRTSFGLELKDLPQIEQWVRAAQIRWGLNAEHKSEAVTIKKFANPVDYAENTWLFGLKRLLLACALPGNMQQSAYDDILSIDEISYDHKAVLGSLLNFFEALQYFHADFTEKYTPEQWQVLLLKFLDTFFKGEDDFSEKDRLQKALQNMVKFSRLGGFQGRLHLETVRKFIQTELENADFERGFLSHGVTFCSAKPMRSIPFKVVCFLGMDLENFPAKEHGASFDLIAKNRRRGDRSKRLDDKYLFLEALVSARDVFYVSYTGHNIADNTAVPPSVMVSELLETVAESFTDAEGLTPVEHVVTRHKMHAFDSAYFNGLNDKFFSYSRGNYLVAAGGDALRLSFINSHGLLSADEKQALTEISPRDFAAFFLNPARAYAKKRLNINLESLNDEVLSKEPFELKELEGYAVRREVLDLMLKNMPPAQILCQESQKGRLPHGSLGLTALNEIYGELKPFARRIGNNADLNDGHGLSVQNVDIYAGDLHIKGPLPVLCRATLDYAEPYELCFFSFSSNKAEHKLTAWLYHVLAQAQGLGGKSLFMDRSQTLVFDSIAAPLNVLETLGDLYLTGMQSPLPFFPRTGLKYGELVYANSEKAESACLTEWHDSGFAEKAGESADGYVKLCFAEEHGREIPPDFYEIAPQICLPFYQHVTKLNEEGA